MSPEWSGRCHRRISPLLLKNRRGEIVGSLDEHCVRAARRLRP